MNISYYFKSVFLLFALFQLSVTFGQSTPLTVTNNTSCEYRIEMTTSHVCSYGCSTGIYCIPSNSTITIPACFPGNANYEWNHGEIYISNSTCTLVCVGATNIIATGICSPPYFAQMDPCDECPSGAKAVFGSPNYLVIQ